MNRLIILVLFALVIFAGNIMAQDDGYGLGIILGEPTGICGKLWMGDNTAIDGAIAWSLNEKSALHLHGDYLIHNFNSIDVEKVNLTVYYGIGGRIRLSENKGDDNLGIRVPIGLIYIFANTQLDLFLEIVPILDLTPNTDFGFNAALGIRYYF